MRFQGPTVTPRGVSPNLVGVHRAIQQTTNLLQTQQLVVDSERTGQLTFRLLQRFAAQWTGPDRRLTALCGRGMWWWGCTSGIDAAAVPTLPNGTVFTDGGGVAKLALSHRITGFIRRLICHCHFSMDISLLTIINATDNTIVSTVNDTYILLLGNFYITSYRFQ